MSSEGSDESAHLRKVLRALTNNAISTKSHLLPHVAMLHENEAKIFILGLCCTLIIMLKENTSCLRTSQFFNNY